MDLSLSSFDDLPNELVRDILSRLPVKTLVQSTCVCKTWYSIIKTPSFISYHYSRSISDLSNFYILLIHYYCYSPFINVLSDNHLLTRNPNLNFHFETQSKTRVVIGTCNGLVCITDAGEKYRGHDIYLINPFIHKYKKIVVESSCYADLIAQINPKTGTIEVGFGYCEDENDYKLVRILIQYSSSKRSAHTAKVEIYSLKSRTWKKGIDMSFKIPPGRSPGHIDTVYELQPGRSPVFVNRCLYWWCLKDVKYDSKLSDEHLLCFDLKDEVFSEIKLPTVFFERRRDWQTSILAKNDSVAMVLCTTDPNNCLRICVLVLEKDIGGHVQWKEFNYETVNLNKSVFVYLGFSVFGKLVILTDWNNPTCPTWNIVAVDLDNSCAIEKLALDANIFNAAFNVVESLVLFSD